MQNILRASIEFNFGRQKYFSKQELIVGKEAFAREFKTLHLDLGRQVGKTTAIKELSRPNDLIIVHNRATIDCSYRGFDNVIAPHQLDNLIFSHRIGYTRRNPLRFGYVWIDEPLMCEKSMYSFGNSLISLLTSEIEADLFIKLGE